MEFFNKSYGFLYDDVKTFYWDFDDGTTLISNDSLSFKHSFPNIYNKDTTYYISLVAENSCGTNTFKKPLLVVPKNVKAAFEVSNVSGCQPFTVSFESNQLPNTSNTLIWLWGDGENAGASGGFEREYTYLEAGQFTASLQVINGCNIDTAMVKINVKESPKTTFLTDKDNYCFGDSITVLNQTLGDIFSVWMINNTQINRYQPDPFYYDKTGNYEISLTSSIQETGCEMTVNKTVTIQPVPVANFTISESACQTENISLVNLSSGASKYYWVFDSLTYNLPIIEETPRYAFISSGFKEIQLIAENEFGCQDSTIVPITIYPQPQPLFETDISYGCPPLLVDITNRTVNPSITQGLLQWNFGNGNKYTEYYDIANQVYENDSDTIASYFISLVAQNGFGCVDTLIQEITVYPMPKPDFVITPKDSMYVDEALYIFKNETEGNDLTHYWNFGDSTYITNNNYSVPHQYTMYGTYNVTLKSVLNQCADSISKRVIVLPVMPVSEFVIYDLDGIEYDTIKGCYPLKVVFQDRSLYAEVYNWDFGNNTEYAEKLPPTITYYDAGVYNVSLTTSNIVGNDIIVKNKVVQVFERPLAAFIANPELTVMPNSRINFINHSIGGNEFTWNFGDDSDLNYEFEPQHTYLDTGSYFVSLVALSNIGCIDTSGTERKVQIISGGEVSIPNTFTPNNDGLNDVFKLLSDGVVSMNLKVFNRWGNLIFESEDLETGWDGSFRGTASPSGVYAYKVFLEFSNGISRSKVGEILLIR
ncbi:MAG: PKD domain-containing protein, partial [Candidatus Heimdallarchaeota archaeon]